MLSLEVKLGAAIYPVLVNGRNFGTFVFDEDRKECVFKAESYQEFPPEHLDAIKQAQIKLNHDLNLYQYP